MNSLSDLDLQEAAREGTGNWQQFESFCWHRASELDTPEDWSIVYTHHRDSGLLDQSNAAAIEEAMEPFMEADDPDVVAESHNHWAVAWIDGEPSNRSASRTAWASVSEVNSVMGSVSATS